MKYLKTYEELLYVNYKYVIVCKNEKEFVDVQKYIKKNVPQIKFNFQKSYYDVKNDFISSSDFSSNRTIDEVYPNLKDENSPIFLYILPDLEIITGDIDKWIEYYDKKGIPVIKGNDIEQLSVFIESKKLGLM